jgi:glycerol kinase
MTLSTDAGAIVRAVVEGITAQVAALASVFATDLGSPLTSLRVDGGLTSSRTLMQAQADLLQVPVEVFPSPHATPLGAAALAQMALDHTVALADVLPQWRPSAIFEPSWSADRAAGFMAGWLAAAELSAVPGGVS